MTHKIVNAINQILKIIYTITNGVFLGWMLVLIFTKHINESNQYIIILVLATLYVINTPIILYTMFILYNKPTK